MGHQKVKSELLGTYPKNLQKGLTEVSVQPCSQQDTQQSASELVYDSIPALGRQRQKV